ncbi:hypothetical protein BHM03_00048685 [Ensete ventricosum]|nr:hypothetical protein BHM03_00048685 [Ensete ventricosum]
MWYRRKWVAAAVATVGKGRMEGKRERHSGSWKREKREEREVPSKRRWCLSQAAGRRPPVVVCKISLVAALRAKLGRIEAEDWNYPGSNSITLKRGLDSSGGDNLPIAFRLLSRHLRFAEGIGKLAGNGKGDRRKEDQRTCRKIAGGYRSMQELGLN